MADPITEYIKRRRKALTTDLDTVLSEVLPGVLDKGTSGTYENTNNGGSIVLRSPNGTRYRITVGNLGTLNTDAI